MTFLAEIKHGRDATVSHYCHVRYSFPCLSLANGVVARIGSGAAWPFGGLAYSLTIARDSGLPNSAIRFNTLHPIIASLFCDS